MFHELTERITLCCYDWKVVWISARALWADSCQYWLMVLFLCSYWCFCPVVLSVVKGGKLMFSAIIKNLSSCSFSVINFLHCVFKGPLFCTQTFRIAVPAWCTDPFYRFVMPLPFLGKSDIPVGNIIVLHTHIH